MPSDTNELTPGALLARLDSVGEELELAAAQAALALARRQHELLEAGERPEEKRRLLAVLDSGKAEEDLARTRALMNLTTRCGTGSARAAFEERPRITKDRRRAFKRLWLSLIRSARMTHAWRFGRMPDGKQRAAMRRQTLQEALLKQRYLTIRRGRLSTPDFGIGVDRLT